MDISKEDPRFNEFQNVKRRFFALRNGIITDTLRRGGDPHRIIFGLTLPQLREVADATPADNALAAALWENSSTRESRLLAPMLMDPEATTIETASAMAETVLGVEEADILCHRLLRRLPFAMTLVDRYKDSDHDLLRYLALRLMLNIIRENPQKAMALSEAETARNCPLTRRLALQTADEADFILQTPAT